MQAFDCPGVGRKKTAKEIYRAVVVSYYKKLQKSVQKYIFMFPGKMVVHCKSLGEHIACIGVRDAQIDR